MSSLSIRARVCALLAFVVVIASAAAGSAQAPGTLAGTWKLNVTKSTFSPGPAPTSMSITYAPAGDMMKISVEIVAPDGGSQHWTMTAGYDGKDYTVTGNPDAETISMKRIDDMKGESTFKKGGKVMAVNARTLSADGKTLTIVTKGKNGQGKPRHDVAVYDKGM